MNIPRTFLTTALVLITAGTLVACGQEAEQSQVEESMSNAGDAVEQSIDNVGDALNSAGEAIDDTMTDTGNAVEDVCEDIKEGVETANDNC